LRVEKLTDVLERRYNLSKQDFALAIVHAVSAGSTWILARAFYFTLCRNKLTTKS